jgi:hypothetical protein
MHTLPTPELVGRWRTEHKVRALHWIEGQTGKGSRSDFSFKDLPETSVVLKTTDKVAKLVVPLVQPDHQEYDKSLFASHNKSSRTASKLHRKQVRALGIAIPDMHEAQRAWRRTVNILKLNDAKDEVSLMEASKAWHNMLTPIVKQELNEKRELVARLNARVIIRK